MKRPSFAISPCPICSTAPALERPYWHCARNTTERRKKSCYMWVGCKHAQPLSPITRIIDDPTEWASVEASWRKFVVGALEAVIALMSAVAGDHFRTAMQERSFLPGVTAALPLEEAPAEPESCPEPRPSPKPAVRKPYVDDDDRAF